jgi:cytochrome c-type biogenesis protein
MEVAVSIPLAFVAGLVSFLSACILPVVPGYVGVVSALTLDERAAGGAVAARRGAAVLSVLFMVGFGLVFLSFGLVPTRIGPPIAHALPWIQRLGGVMLALYGAHLLGAFRLLGRENWSLSGAAAGLMRRGGAVAAGIAFGAGWTPCIGPVLGSILLYVTREDTMTQGGLLMVAYAVGLSLPFVATSLAVSWPLAGSRSLERWVPILRRGAGGVILVLGLAMVTGYFATLTASLAGLGQLINLEL